MNQTKTYQHILLDNHYTNMSDVMIQNTRLTELTQISTDIILVKLNNAKITFVHL